MASSASKFLSSPPTIQVIACPFSGGQKKGGVDGAPIALLAAGLIGQLEELEWKVSFNEPLAESFLSLKPEEDANIGKMINPRTVSKVCKEVGRLVGEATHAGHLPLTLGGDHSLAMGTVSGTLSKYPDACLIWIDAHADINTPLTTDSGNLHGCPVSFLMGLEGTDVAPFNEWVKPCLAPNKIVYIGLRDIDSGERKILKENKIKAFSMHEVDKYGIGKVVEMALDHVNPNRDLPIHLSYDVDALDPAVAPSTGTPVRGGLTFREGHYICESVCETGLLVALDIMEVNPSLEDPISVAQTVAVGCSLTRAALGETLL
ncbi:hypothetical protein BDY24DRAFT_404135 [Mrakia frigida]|uniref:arginase n=1 Tax=Mrakia frigida TaxID=29902 RepID=UPI003FCBEF95